MIIVDSQEFSEALGALSKVISSSANSAVYQCVLMHIKQGKLILRGTDLFTFVERSIEITKQDEADLQSLVVFKPLYDYVRACNGNLSISFGKTDITVKSKGDLASPKIRSKDDFTKWPKWSSMTMLSGADPKAFVDAIKTSLGVVSVSLLDARLYNISIVLGQAKIDIQSSDGYRYIVSEAGKSDSSVANILLPYSAAIRCLDISSDKVKRIAYSETLLGIETEAGMYFMRLNSGSEQYPIFRGKIPSKFSFICEVLKKDLEMSVQKAISFSDDKYRKILLNPTKNDLILTAENDESGKYKGTIKIKKAKGTAFDIFLDASHIVFFLKICSSDSIVIAMTEPDGPVMFKDKDQPKLVYVVYPLKIHNS